MPRRKPHVKRNPLSLMVGDNITRLRRDRGWNQTELGARCSEPISQKRVSDLERGVKNAQLDTLGRVARALEVDPYALLLPPLDRLIKKGDPEIRGMIGFITQSDHRTRKYLNAVMDGFAAYRPPPPPPKKSRRSRASKS